jgi:hypothetical protein
MSYVETWKGIAHALGRSERWCRYMARRTADPLPVFKVGGIVRLNGCDLEEWLGRQRDRSFGRPLGDGIGQMSELTEMAEAVSELDERPLQLIA